ncbi:MAG: hypothetical protein ACO225_05440 [Ilumatobacteraceae bacterium]
MIIRLSTSAPPALDDLDRFDRLHATADADLSSTATGSLCRWDADDDEHVWLDVAEARATIVDAGRDAAAFDSMIGYAASKGWLDAAGTHVRAHVERT